MYEVIFDDGQGVLLSGSKACLPVLGYFTGTDKKSIFDDDMPEGLQFLLEEYREQIEWCFLHDTVQLYFQDEWKSLQQSSLTKASGTPPTQIIVAPLLTSHWGQRYSNDNRDCNAYNYYAPDKNCSACQTKCHAGCVAVAMAQIMYYWKYPVYNPFMHAIDYDWCSMPDELNTNSPDYAREREAVARLIKECGLTVDMDYGCSGSGARSPKARKAFVERFGYHSNADFQRKFWHSNSTWKNRIRNDLNIGRPVYYCSISNHAFVCDGYGSDEKFHFNFGWNDSGYFLDNWFTLDDLTPNGSNYNSRQAAIFYLRPNGSQNYCNFSVPLATHYEIVYGLTPANYPPYQYVPKIFYNMESVDSSLGYPASWSIIPSGATAEYVARNSITLRPGFHVQAGATFTARIEPCSNCQNNTRSEIDTQKDETIVTEDSVLDIQEFLEPYNDLTDKFDFTIYPNPNDGNFTLVLNTEEIHSFYVEIFNSSGISVFASEYCDTRLININCSNLPKGIYYVKVLMGNNVSTKRIVIE